MDRQDLKDAQQLVTLAAVRARQPEDFADAADAVPDLAERAGDAPEVLAVVNVVYVDAEQGELAVGIEQDRASEHAEAEAALRELVPNVPLRVFPCRVIRDSCPSKKQDCRPMVGGIRINSDSTLCVARSTKSGVGTVLSGHAVGAGTGQTVGQPSVNSSYGKVTVNPPLNMRQSDSALAMITNRRVTASINTIWQSASSTFNVTAYDTEDSLQVGDPVFMQGAQTEALQSGTVTATGVTVVDKRGTLTNQVSANYSAKGGDSGAPIFQKTGGDDVKVVGLHAGRVVEGATEVPFFSTWKATAAELGL